MGSEFCFYLTKLFLVVGAVRVLTVERAREIAPVMVGHFQGKSRWSGLLNHTEYRYTAALQ